MSHLSTPNDLKFIAQGGEMGRLTREKDWNNNPIGPISKWPQSLKTTLGILINSKFPMFLFWGKDLICFYNDAYRPSLGKEGKHPDILGMKAAEAWPEIWEVIQPLIEQVMTTGEATWHEDALIPIYRNHTIEDVYWTFSYSPVYDENSTVSGVLVTCNETTEKVKTFQKLSESNLRYAENLKQAPIAMCIFRGKDFVVEIANEKMLELWGKKAEDVMDKPIFEGLPEAKAQGLETLLEKVYTTGEKFEANERPVNLPRNGALCTTYINFVYEALYENDHQITGIVATAVEVTHQVQARERLEEAQQKTKALVENAPFAIAVYTGQEMTIELANQAIIDIWGKGNEVIGKTFTELLPELAGQSVFEQIKAVYSTGKAFHTRNTPLDLVVNGKKNTFYFDYDFTPLYDLSGKIYGVMNTGLDVTEVNLAKQQIEQSDAKFRNTVKQAPVGITILRGKDYVVEMANDAYLKLVDRPHETFVGKPLFESLPEVKETVKSLLDGVLNTGIPYHGNESPIPLLRQGKISTNYFDFLYHPLKEDDGHISGIIVTATEVTEKVQARKKIEQNEEKLQIVIQASELGIYELNLVTDELQYSTKLLEIFGIEESEKPIHEQLVELIHPDDLEIRRNAHIESIQTGYLNYQARIIWPDQSIHWMEGKGTVFYDQQQKPLKLLGTVRDITKEKLHQLKLEESEKRFRQLADSAPVLIWMSDTSKKSYFFNKGWLDFTGNSMEDETNGGWTKGVHPDDLEKVLSICAQAFDQRAEFSTDYRLKRHDGVYRWISEKGVPRFNTEGGFEGYIGACMDIHNEITNKELLIENEKKFRLLADSMPQHIWTSDPEGNLNYFNKSVFKYSGMTHAEITAKGWLDIVHPDDRDENVKQWTNSIQTGIDFLFEHRFRRHDGEYRWQLSRAIPQIDENGKIQMWVGTSTDIQDQKEFTRELEKLVAERTKELKESEERYHLMIEEIQDYAILYINKDGTIENWNKGAEKIKGYKADEIIGKNFSEFYTAEDRQNKLPQYLLSQAIEHGRHRQEGWRVRKDGSPFWASVTITAVHNDKQEIIGFSKVTHDLSAKKQAEDKIRENSAILEEKNHELEKMNKELQQFAYISSHDLQEPLRKIQTFSNQIIDREFENLSEIGKDRFQRMQNAAQRMQTLINDLLTYSRTNTQERKLIKTDLNLIIEDVREDLADELLHKNASFNVQKIDCEVEIIPFQFHQLLYNLVSNSLKFAREGVDPVIEIECEIQKGAHFKCDRLIPDIDYCHIRFSDNGIGFEQHYNEKIFEVFQRLHGREVYQGTGIGLAIVKKIIDNHNGAIKAEGEPGKGAIFNIFFPTKGISSK